MTSSLRPSPREERWLAALALAAPQRLDAAQTSLSAERSGGWRVVRFFSRCAFFVLGLVGAGLTVGIGELLHVPGHLLLSGVVLIGAGEWLTHHRRVFAGGTEEALALVGALCVTYQLLPSTHGVSETLVLAIGLAAALAVVGLRLLNPLCTTAAVVALSFAWASAPPLQSSLAVTQVMSAAVGCFAIAGVALLLGRTSFARPSHDRMLDWLVAVMPLCGFLWSLSAIELHGGGLALALPLLFAVAALVTGLRRRTHAPLVACLICLGCVAYELHLYTDVSLQNRLLLDGCSGLLIALALNRGLRTPRRGVTSRQIGPSHGSLEFLQLAGTAALAPLQTPASDPKFQGGGGSFSGGGADGSY